MKHISIRLLGSLSISASAISPNVAHGNMHVMQHIVQSLQQSQIRVCHSTVCAILAKHAILYQKSMSTKQLVDNSVRVFHSSVFVQIWSSKNCGKDWITRFRCFYVSRLGIYIGEKRSRLLLDGKCVGYVNSFKHATEGTVIGLISVGESHVGGKLV